MIDDVKQELDPDLAENVEAARDVEKGQDLVATLRSSRYEDQDLRRHALERAVDLGEAAHRGGCDVTGKEVVANAGLFYDFLRGHDA